MSTWAEIEKAFRRSKTRMAVLLMLASLSEASPRALAMACGIDARRLRQVMFGELPGWRVELALITLGLAETRETPNGTIYVITERGRRKARQLTARSVRRARAREVNRHVRFPARVATPVAAGPRTCGDMCVTEFRHVCSR